VRNCCTGENSEAGPGDWAEDIEYLVL